MNVNELFTNKTSDWPKLRLEIAIGCKSGVWYWDIDIGINSEEIKSLILAKVKYVQVLGYLYFK